MAEITTTTTTATTTATTTHTNKGTQLQVGATSTTSTVGNFVSDVTIQPYIKNTVVSFYAYNLRPNSNVHIFFDSVLVDQYCAPATAPIPTSPNTNFSINGSDIVKSGNWGDTIKTNSLGQVAGQFNIPDNTFRFGDRILEITDVDNLVQGNDAITTLASSRLTASPYTSVTKQTLTLTTINPSFNFIPVTNTYVTSNTTVNSTSNTFVSKNDVWNVSYTSSVPKACAYNDPLAQTLTILTPNRQAGIFATSLDLFFEQSSFINNGVVVYLCEMVNGYPDGDNILPYSIVHLNAAEINTSDDATVATKFTFPSPVFLQTNKTYAFVVRPDASDPDYRVFTANLGDIDISTGRQVSSQPVVGPAFYGATDTVWTALQTEYVKFTLNIANFTQSSANVMFHNDDYDLLTVYNITLSNTQLNILSGDIVFQASNASVNSISSNTYGIVNYYDDVRGLIYVANSSGNFSSNSFIQVHRFPSSNISSPNSVTYIAYANTSLPFRQVYNTLVPQIATMQPAGTTIDMKYNGLSSIGVFDDQYYSISTGGSTNFYDKTRMLFGKTEENLYMGGKKSANLQATLFSDSTFISPVIDTVKSNLLLVKNYIDPVITVYEEFFNTGSSRSKYISQIITLANGQDSEDLQVIVTAHRPPGSDVQVWVRFLNSQDPESMSNKTWTPLKNINLSLFCDPGNPNDFKEFTYSVNQGYNPIARTGTITCNSSSNTVTGNNTLFGYEVFNGWYINMYPNTSFKEEARKIVSVANSTSLTLEEPFNGNYTSNAYFLVPPPTTAYLAQNTYIQIPGTVKTSTTNTSIIGTNTNFTEYFSTGSIISVAGDKQQVVSVTNNTYLSVGANWTSAANNATAFYVSDEGLTYLNDSGSQFNKFKKFQIKVILQSNDLSKVPLIDNLRAMALQL